MNMKMMNRLGIYAWIGLVVVGLTLPATSTVAASKKEREKAELSEQVKETIAQFKKADEGMAEFFKTSAGYAVFPKVAKGGLGGSGNTRFATAVNQTPEIATEGAPGEERCLVFKLELPTDICIIGLPNSGKSALLATISQAKPRIADYPFSTREPVLGVVQGDRRDFVVAEIPALVQGAHVGKGLGSEFLCHVERTGLIIYLLDGTSFDVLDDLDTLNRELLLYSSDLLDKAKIVAINKIDLPEVQARLPQIKQSLSRLDLPVFFVSAATGYGISELNARAMAVVEETSKVKEAALPQVGIFRPKPGR